MRPAERRTPRLVRLVLGARPTGAAAVKTGPRLPKDDEWRAHRRVDPDPTFCVSTLVFSGRRNTPSQIRPALAAVEQSGPVTVYLQNGRRPWER